MCTLPSFTPEEFRCLNPNSHHLIDALGCIWKPVRVYSSSTAWMIDPKGRKVFVTYYPERGMIVQGLGALERLNHPKCRIKTI